MNGAPALVALLAAFLVMTYHFILFGAPRRKK
jgi:hypothetical protein